jgi:hypothetical protein
MTNDPFEYDVAVSFASADKDLANKLAQSFTDSNVHVVLDEITGSEPGGGEFLDHLVNLYARKARYCVLLVSTHYPLASWTEAERTSLQERALRDPNEYILPILLDDRTVPGLVESAGRVEQIVDVIEQRLVSANRRSGPPSQSHDLRSGNVPSS